MAQLEWLQTLGILRRNPLQGRRVENSRSHAFHRSASSRLSQRRPEDLGLSGGGSGTAGLVNSGCVGCLETVGGSSRSGFRGRTRGSASRSLRNPIVRNGSDSVPLPRASIKAQAWGEVNRRSSGTAAPEVLRCLPIQTDTPQRSRNSLRIDPRRSV